MINPDDFPEYVETDEDTRQASGNSKFVPIDGDDDPERCQGIIAHGQCRYKRIPGCNYCIRHGGAQQLKTQERERKSNYKLVTWQLRLNELRGHEEVKSLRDEIGIARMSLEALMNKCKNEHDLLIYNSQINNTVSSIEKLVNSCQKLEERNSLLMDKEQLIAFVDKISIVIGEHVLDPDVVKNIGSRIYEEFTKTIGRKDEE